MVLSDDAFRKILHEFDKKKGPKVNPAAPPATPRPTGNESTVSSPTSDEEAAIDTIAVVNQPHSSKGGKNRNGKRGASSALSGPSAKK